MNIFSSGSDTTVPIWSTARDKHLHSDALSGLGDQSSCCSSSNSVLKSNRFLWKSSAAVTLCFNTSAFFAKLLLLYCFSICFQFFFFSMPLRITSISVSLKFLFQFHECYFDQGDYVSGRFWGHAMTLMQNNEWCCKHASDLQMIQVLNNTSKTDVITYFMTSPFTQIITLNI